jgi:hypothetical protein
MKKIVDADTDVRVPEAAPLFNILYGMFPCNMLKFLQSPTNYTMEVECCYGRVIIKEDDELIRTESMVRFNHMDDDALFIN